MKRLIFLALVSAGLLCAQFTPGTGGVVAQCVGAPGNTAGNFLTFCADTNGLAYLCNNAPTCSTAAQWVKQQGSGSFAYPAGTGFTIVTAGTSWGTTLADLDEKRKRRLGFEEEGNNMPKKKTNESVVDVEVLPPTFTPTPTLDTSVEVAIRNEVSVQADGLTFAISSLTIDNSDDYLIADELFGQIREARKRAEEIFAEKIRTPIIEPTRKALDALYRLERELTKLPFEAPEKLVKSKMADWQRQERERIEHEREVARQEEMRKQRAAFEAQQAALLAAQNARTAAQRQEAQKAAAVAAKRAEEAEVAKHAAVEASREQVSKGTGSRVTVKRIPVVTDWVAFLKGVLDGTVPLDAVQLNPDVVGSLWRTDAGLVSAWPGVTVKEEVSVGGR
jgi:hypothetical protein